MTTRFCYSIQSDPKPKHLIGKVTNSELLGKNKNFNNAHKITAENKHFNVNIISKFIITFFKRTLTWKSFSSQMPQRIKNITH